MSEQIINDFTTFLYEEEGIEIDDSLIKKFLEQ